MKHVTKIAIAAAASVVAAAAVLLAVLLAGGSSPVVPPTPGVVAHQIGAVITGHADKGPFAKAAAQAEWHGRQVVIATFTSDAMKQVYIKYVVSADKAFGITAAPMAQGHDYVVFPQ